MKLKDIIFDIKKNVIIIVLYKIFKFSLFLLMSRYRAEHLSCQAIYFIYQLYLSNKYLVKRIT